MNADIRHLHGWILAEADLTAVATKDPETKVPPGERPRRTARRTSRVTKGSRSGLQLEAVPALVRTSPSDRCNAQICEIRSSASRIDLLLAADCLRQAEPASVPGRPKQECRSARCR